MRLDEITEAKGDEDDLIEQLLYADASKVTDLYSLIAELSEEFSSIPDKIASQKLKMLGMQMFQWRADAIKSLGNDSDTVHRINKVIEYIKQL